jgi:hypothetical protein
MTISRYMYLVARRDKELLAYTTTEEISMMDYVFKQRNWRFFTALSFLFVGICFKSMFGDGWWEIPVLCASVLFFMFAILFPRSYQRKIVRKDMRAPVIQLLRTLNIIEEVLQRKIGCTASCCVWSVRDTERLLVSYMKARALVIATRQNEENKLPDTMKRTPKKRLEWYADYHSLRLRFSTFLALSPKHFFEDEKD